jgi:hypothetical protein
MSAFGGASGLDDLFVAHKGVAGDPFALTGDQAATVEWAAKWH